MSDHSLGPWTLTTEEDWDGEPKFYLESADGKVFMGGAQYYPWTPHNPADWKLMSAAPELLEALKEMAVWYGSYHEDDCPCDDTCDCKHKPFNDRVNNAINKALGE